MRYLLITAVFVSIFNLCGAVLAAPMLDGEMTDINAAPGGGPTSTWWETQSVTPTRDVLKSVEFFINPGSVDWNATVAVYGQTSDNGTALTTLLGTSVVALTPGQNGIWHTFNFADIDISDYTAAAGAGRLLLVLKGDGDANAGRYTYGYIGAEDKYAGGVWRYTPNSGDDFIGRGGDMVFRIYTDVVPEPTALSLLGLSALVLRRRK